MEAESSPSKQANSDADDGNEEDEEEAEEIVMSKAEKKAIQAAKSGQAILADSRFSSLFTNPDFAIDEETEEFKSVSRRTASDEQ